MGKYPLDEGWRVRKLVELAVIISDISCVSDKISEQVVHEDKSARF